MPAIRVIGNRGYPRTVFDGDSFAITDEVDVDISVILKTVKRKLNVAVIRRRAFIFFNAILAHVCLVAVDVLIRICFVIGYASVAEIAACDVTIFR